MQKDRPIWVSQSLSKDLLRVQNATGPWPMHEVVPRAVRAAVRIDTMT